jgi:S1-C subfamily serine protease
MVPNNILQRVRQVWFGDRTGTAFAVEVDGRQYLITARHLADASADSTTVRLRNEENWLAVPGRRLEVLPKEADVAVFAPAIQLAPDYPISLVPEVFVSEELYFVGYPFGRFINGTNVNAGFPLPFVKRAICSAFSSVGPAFRGFVELFLDGINNPGFSGGPVVSMRSGANEPRIVGVISDRTAEVVPVFSGDNETCLSVR